MSAPFTQKTHRFTGRILTSQPGTAVEAFLVIFGMPFHLQDLGADVVSTDWEHDVPAMSHICSKFERSYAIALAALASLGQVMT